MTTQEAPVIVSQQFNCPSSKVWSAITELQQMKQWFFADIPEFRAEEGFSTQFNVKAPSRDFMHLWTIKEVEHGKKIVYDWSYEGLAGRGEVIFAIDGAGSGCSLTLTNIVTEDFPQEIPEFKRESCEGGWQYFIQQQLKTYLENI